MSSKVKKSKSIKFGREAITKAWWERVGQLFLLIVGSLLSGFFVYFVGIQICRTVWPNMPDPDWYHMLLILPVARIVFGVTFVASRAWEIKVPEKRPVVPVYDQSRTEIETVLVEQLPRIHVFVFSLVLLLFVSPLFLIGWLALPVFIQYGNVFAVPYLLLATSATMAAIGWVVYCVIKIFTVSPQFYVRGTALPLGSTSILRWQTNSGFGRLDSLSLELVGEEVAWYTAGTDRVEAANVFHLVPLLKTTDRDFIRNGSVELRIPANSMHTLTASENQVRWMLRVRGNIPWLPKLKEEFEIQVSPQVSQAKVASNNRT